MQPFKFVHGNEIGPWTGQGEIIEGFDSFVWVERYRDPGEFEIEAPLGSAITLLLPPGSLISHTDTYEICMVESHNIVVDGEGNPTVRISGRSLDAFVDYRVVSEHEFHNWPNTGDSPLANYIIPSNPTWVQAVRLVQEHGLFGLPEIVVRHIPAGQMNLQQPSPPQEARSIKRESVHKVLLTLLDMEDLGINVYRKHFSLRNFAPGDPANGFVPGDVTFLWVHGGRDLSASVIFSYMQGDIESADYLLTNLTNRTAALVVGRYGMTLADEYKVGFLRRTMVLDGSSIDNDWNPQGQALWPGEQMAEYGRRMISGRNTIGIFNVRTSQSQRLRYKVDYDIGDIIRVEGQFNALTRMRVTEHTLTVGRDGTSSFPTLSALRAGVSGRIEFPTTSEE